MLRGGFNGSHSSDSHCACSGVCVEMSDFHGARDQGSSPTRFAFATSAAARGPFQSLSVPMIMRQTHNRKTEPSKKVV